MVSKPRHRPRRLYTDRGYDDDKYRRLVRTRAITPLITRRSVEHDSSLDTVR